MEDRSFNIIIRRGNTEELIDLRHEILRTGLPRESAYFKGDDEPTTIHVVAALDGKVVGCATMLQRRWEHQSAWQLRGMAVAPSLRGTGIGGKLLNEIERLADAQDFSNQFWANARVPAVKFYQDHGWTVVSEEFMIEHAGPHVKIKKRMEPQVNTDQLR
ncbi:MAG: GNAT family N-acetyltransferase [Anaerolineae bacterium]|nr:GNAT family N-acetyltransferase [Phycisphaerae bacterium]